MSSSAIVQSDSAPGQDVTVDFADLGKQLGAFKWPSGRDVHDVRRSSILETDVQFEPRAGGRSWIITNATIIQTKFKHSI